MFSAAGTNLRLIRRLLTASFVDVSPILHGASKNALVATALTFGALGFGVSDANAQLFRNSTSQNERNATQSSPERSKLFSGKLLRNFTETTSNRDAQTAKSAQSANQTASNAARSNARYSGSAPTNETSGRNYPTAQRPGASSANASRGSYLSTTPGASAFPTASVEPLTQASTDRAFGREIAAKIPWNALSPEARQKLRALTANPTIYRRLPMAGGHCNPELFDFLLCRPHAVVAFWNQMGYDDLTMTAKGPNRYELREKTGTIASVQILYQDAELALVYCSGSYRGPLVARPLEGEMLLVLQTRYTEDEANRPVVVCRMDSFVDLKNAGADLLARTFAGPLGKVADSNFEQTVAFIDSLSQTAETSPSELIASVSQLRTLSPEDRRLLAAKTTEVARQARLRAQGELVQYRTLPKKNLPNETFARILSRESNGASPRPSQLAANPANRSSRLSANSAPRSGSIYAPRRLKAETAPRIDDFKNVSLADDSFALADDLGESDSVDLAPRRSDDDFDATINWEDENNAVVPNAGSNADAGRSTNELGALKPATSATSTAKAVAKTSPKYSGALDLLDEAADSDASNANVGAPAANAPTNLATEDGLELLADFETELAAGNENAEIVDEAAEGPNADVAIPFLDAGSTNPQANGGTVPRRNALSSFNAKPVPLKTSADAAKARSNAAAPVATLEAAPRAADLSAETPVLYLPDIADENADAANDAAPASPETSAEKTTGAAENNAPKTSAPTETTSGAGVWRPVQIDRSTTKKVSDAAPVRVDKTAEIESSDGVSFRKPVLK